MKDYVIIVHYSEEDECYIADIPDLKFCSAYGATPVKAVRELEKAKKAWLQTAREQGKPIPEPRSWPAISQPSG